MPDIVTSKIFVDGEKGITASKLNQIMSGAVIQPSFVSGKPASSTLDPTDQLLELKGTGSYATITGQQLIDSVSASVTQNIQPTIWSVRLRSINAVQNSAFEVDQINTGSVVANANAKIIDRWFVAKGGTMVVSAGRMNAGAGEVVVPGTSFCISNRFFRVTLTTAQATLAATDSLLIYQSPEGSLFRELSLDVHSVSLLVRSSQAGFAFGLSLRDPVTATKSLVKLCTIPSANTWTLISLPNLPIWPAGNFTSAPGFQGYLISLALAAGSSLATPANDTWQNGNFVGAVGQSNFATQAVNSTFDVAFVQHEPGSQCSTLIDCPFTQAYDDALRYYCKSYDYGTKAGTVTNNGIVPLFDQAGAALGPVIWPKPLARVPATLSIYNHQTGAANSVWDSNGAANRTVTGFVAFNEKSMAGLAVTGVTAVAGANCYAHYVADTGW